MKNRAENILAGLLALSAAGCGEPYAWDGSLESMLASQPQRFAAVLEDPDKHRLQIIYTQIDRDAQNQPTFRSHTYRLNADEYFYPASTVKLPAAAIALEKLADLGIDRETEMQVADEIAGKSVGRYVREILLVSDNVAFNRLYDFIGQEALNERMRALGHDGVRIMHRLQIAMSLEENQKTGPIRFTNGETSLYTQPADLSATDFTAPLPILLGKAEVVGGELQDRPKDFATKNAFPLQAQHDVIKALMFPDAVAESQRFRLSREDYAFIYQNMSAYAAQSGIAAYSDKDQYPDGWVKFLMYGGDEPDIPANIRIFNKVGDAYGFLTDAAYIVDFENGVEFILAATIYTNENQTFNDDNYEYDEIGLPFLRNLGQAIYEIELERERSHRPDLSKLKSLLTTPAQPPLASPRQ